MQQNQTHADRHYPNNDEIEISLTDLAKSLYAGRRFILLLTVACVALVLGIAKVTAQYKSTSFWYFEGLVKLPGEEAGISLAEYNRIMDSAKKYSRFNAYIDAMKLEDSPEVELLRKLFTSREGIATQIKPFRSSLNESKRVTGADAPILGVSLEITAPSGELAQAALLLLSNYLADTLTYDLYNERLLDKLDSYQTLDAKTENQLIAFDVRRLQLEKQHLLVEKLIEKYATFFETSRKAETLIATEDTLISSPIGRLMALELEIAGLDDQYEQLMRKKKQIHFFLSYYQQALELSHSAGSGEHFFKKLTTILPPLFNAQDLQDEVVKEAYNDLLIETNSAANLYQKRSRQLVKPNLPNAPTTRFALLAAASLLAGLVLACILVLMHTWWREVTAPN